MAFPQVRDAAAGATTSDSTTHSVVLPAAVVSGDILLAFFSCDGVPTLTWDNSTAGTWTVGSNTVRGTLNRFAIHWKRADGTEGGKTLSVTTSAAEQAVFRVVAISGAHDTTNPAFGTAANATSATPNPPALTPSWGAADTLWFACFGNDDGRRSMSAVPANYGNQFYDSSNGPSGCGLGTARRELNDTSDDPGTFTISASQGWVAQTVAIRPEPAGIVGTFNQTLGAATSSGAGSVSLAGTASNTLGASTASAAGGVSVAGTAANALGAATLAATGMGQTEATGDLSVTLGAATGTAGGSVGVAGTASQTLSAMTGSAAGSAAVSGSTAATLGTLAASASGAVEITATLAQPLGAAGASASGAAEAAGSLSADLGALSAASAGAVDVLGSAALSLDAATVSAQGGSPALTGDAAITLDAATLVASAAATVGGSASLALDTLALSAAGAVQTAGVDGSLSAELDDLAGAADGGLEVAGELAETLELLVALQSLAVIPVAYIPRALTQGARNNTQAETRPAQDNRNRDGTQADYAARRNAGVTGRS